MTSWKSMNQPSNPDSLDAFMTSISSEPKLLEDWKIYVPVGEIQRGLLMERLERLGCTIAERGPRPHEIPKIEDTEALEIMKSGWMITRCYKKYLNVRANHIILNIKWLDDSERHNRVMPTKYYTIANMAAKDFKAKQIQQAKFRGAGVRDVLRKRARSSDNSSGSGSSSSSNSNSFGNHIKKRRRYNEEDDEILVAFANDNSAGYDLCGNILWKLAEDRHLIEGRSWQSMRDRYVKYARKNGIPSSMAPHPNINKLVMKVSNGNQMEEEMNDYNASYHKMSNKKTNEGTKETEDENIENFPSQGYELEEDDDLLLPKEKLTKNVFKGVDSRNYIAQAGPNLVVQPPIQKSSFTKPTIITTTSSSSSSSSSSSCFSSIDKNCMPDISARNFTPNGICWICKEPTKNPIAKQHKKCRETYKRKYESALNLIGARSEKNEELKNKKRTPKNVVRFQEGQDNGKPRLSAELMFTHHSQQNPLQIEAATWMFTSNQHAVLQFMKLKDNKRLLILRKWGSKTYISTWLAGKVSTTKTTNITKTVDSINNDAKEYYGCVPWSVAEDLRLLKIHSAGTKKKEKKLKLFQKLLPSRDMKNANARLAFLNILFKEHDCPNNLKIIDWYKDETKVLRNHFRHN
jgi:hypothetical protein